MKRIFAPLLLALLVIGGCAANPVTGKKELVLVSEGQEVALGEQSFLPSRQMQGGELVADPALVDYVQRVGQRLAAVSDRPDLPYEFTVLNNTVPNAWALPGGKIAVNRGLLYEMGSEAELAAVLGHEIVHAAARHGAKSMERSIWLQGALLAVQLSTRDNQYSDYIVGAGQLGAMLISQKYGRGAELESDYYGMKYMTAAGYNPAAAVDLQRTFVRLSEARQSDWLSGLFASHPPSQDRVDANRAALEEFGTTGDYGRESYDSATAWLARTRPAYENYDKAVEAYREGNTDGARALVSEALAVEPREAKFHLLLGDIAASGGQYREALGYFDTAQSFNPDFFQVYLDRGLVYDEIGSYDAAEADLSRSIELLPTASAHFSLGNIANRRGQQDRAKQHFGLAAQSNTELGQRASIELARMDLPGNPGAYIQTRVQVDAQGYVTVAVGNGAPVAVHNIVVLVGILDPTGRTMQEVRDFGIRETIGARQSVVLATGIGPVTDAAQLQRVRVQISEAAVAE